MMAGNASRRGAVDFGTVLMVLAFVVIGWFLYWLNAEAAAERALDVVEEPTADSYGPTAIAVQASELQIDPSQFEGELIRVEGLTVASRLGAQGFWLELPNRNPFLVSMSAQAMADGTSVSAGQTVNVIGTITAMNDSIVGAWTSAGTISEGDALAAQFATDFLEAGRVEVVNTGAPGANPGG